MCLDSEKRRMAWLLKCLVPQRIPGTLKFWMLNLPEHQTYRVQSTSTLLTVLNEKI